jgi:phage-related tail fiber protein
MGAINLKDAVVIATTVAGTLATSFASGQVVDGITLTTGDRILIKNQSTGSENGIYVVNTTGAPTRATDADTAGELEDAVLWVTKGTANADTQWKLVTD